MKRKELKINPIPEDSIFSKILAHILLLWPFLPIIFIIIIYNIVGRKDFLQFFQQLMQVKIYILVIIILWFLGTLNFFREIINYVIVEESCYVENKVFYYHKFSRIFGIKKIMKKFEIPLSEISEVKEAKKPFFLYYFFSPIAHRNSVMIETKKGKKYKIMNSVVLSNRNSQNPNSEITSERAKKIYNEVKNIISK